MVTSHSNGRCGGSVMTRSSAGLPAVWCYCGLEMGEVVAFCTANVLWGWGGVVWCGGGSVPCCWKCVG
ncbi:hypothetical protein Pmani_037114 [Petrolisthes manimaculis]|uniref:Uncharacterized protein n=1 Tax=Petrolisthes manimaculis TaxID=1843537 RepID=A0AAE1NGY2_9EUCA|nr:hypothetical protein Pmani_037114 [Petrolisthes manimaculis]